MKLIIDIPNDIYTRLFDNGIQDNEITTDDICEMARTLRLGTPIPDNATNGDVIKAIFGYKRISHFNDNPPLVDVYGLDNNDDTDAVTFYEDWWKAPYQKGGK